MMIHEITEQVGRKKPRKRVGRGEASGLGKTSGRGHKGAKSRSGWTYRPHFEGGQMELFRRLPKRGFTNAPFRKEFAVVNLHVLEKHFKAGDVVDAAALFKARLIRDAAEPVKVLGEGDLTKKLTVAAARFSASAKEKIEKAGGTVTVTERRPAAIGEKAAG